MYNIVFANLNIIIIELSLIINYLVNLVQSYPGDHTCSIWSLLVIIKGLFRTTPSIGDHKRTRDIREGGNWLKALWYVCRCCIDGYVVTVIVPTQHNWCYFSATDTIYAVSLFTFILNEVDITATDKLLFIRLQQIKRRVMIVAVHV